MNTVLLQSIRTSLSTGWYPLSGDARMVNFDDDGYRFVLSPDWIITVWRNNDIVSVSHWDQKVDWS